MKRLATAALMGWVLCAGCGQAPSAPVSTPPRAADEVTQWHPVPAPFAVPVGTEPALVGAPVSVGDFPLGELTAVLPVDAIPALDDPPAGTTPPGYLLDDDLVLGLEIDGEARAYPHAIGWWHEIVNDVVGGRPVCVSFCPLTGTGLAFDAVAPDGARAVFSVSGMIYNSNLVMFQRRNGGLYPQLYATDVRSRQPAPALRQLPLVEMTWRAWRRLHPATLVVAGGHYEEARYGRYPYGDYRTDHLTLLFGIRPLLSSNPNRLATAIAAKDRVLGLRIDGRTRAYRHSDMGQRRAIADELGGLEIVVLRDRAAQMATAFSRRVAGRLLTFDVAPEADLVIVDRETGTRWDAAGRALSGALAGERLSPVPGHGAMWVAWVTFWPDTEVWQP